MKKKILIFSIIFLSLLVYGLEEHSSVKAFDKKEEISSLKTSAKKPVLLELFTSESCFACPPAEKLLSKIENEQPFEKAEIITLEFHVDYRDSFGRKDILASPLFTQRQRVYDRKFLTGKIYTPQMIIDGNLQFAGNNFKKAKKAVNKTVKTEKGNVNLSIKNERLNVNISNLPKHDFLTVYLAIAENGIVTRNRKESEANVSVVRSLNGLGRITPDQNLFEMDTNFYIKEDWKKENINLVVFVQENGSRKILGVGKIKLKTTNVNHRS